MTTSMIAIAAQAQLGPRVGHDRVDRAIDRQHVDPGHGHGRSRPYALAQPACPEERNARLDLGQLTELVVAVRRSRPLLAPEAGHCDIAPLVEEGVKCAEESEERVGRSATELAAVLRAGQRPHLDGEHRHPT
jgi:hypothetical protein